MSEHEKQHIYAAFDMGGTCIKASLLDEWGRIVENTFGTFPACSNQSSQLILDRVTEILAPMLKCCPDGILKGIGFSFPGPFDYENGISYIRGLNKYDSLYGLNIHDEIMERVNERIEAVDGKGSFKILFENDASLFALGECCGNKELQNSSVLCLTLGTGTGSAFIRNRRLVKGEDGIPENGWIYCCPYKDKCVEDYLSRRGIIELAGKRNVLIDEPVSLYHMAVQGEEAAQKIWEEFGSLAGEILTPFMERFGGQYLVLGGQISKAAQFFIGEIKKAAGSKYKVCTATGRSDESIFRGIYQLFAQGR